MMQRRYYNTNVDNKKDSDIENEPVSNLKDETEKNLKIFVRQMLTQRIFQGSYQERRWTEPVKGYRDLIIINKWGNESLIKDMELVKRRLEDHYKGSKWIGLSGPNLVGAPNGFCIWLDFQGVPLGQHTFLIKKVKFTDNEVCLGIKCMTNTNETSSGDIDSTLDEKEMTQDGEAGHVDPMFNIQNINFDEILLTFKEAWKSAYSLITIENTKQLFSFAVVLVTCLIGLILKVIFHSGEFSLKLIDRLTNLLQVLMPLFLSFLDLVKKTIGGLYILLAMIWRSFMERNNPPLPPNPQQQAIWYGGIDRRMGNPQQRLNYGGRQNYQYYR